MKKRSQHASVALHLLETVSGDTRLYNTVSRRSTAMLKITSANDRLHMEPPSRTSQVFSTREDFTPNSFRTLPNSQLTARHLSSQRNNVSQHHLHATPSSLQLDSEKGSLPSTAIHISRLLSTNALRISPRHPRFRLLTRDLSIIRDRTQSSIAKTSRLWIPRAAL
jgi:hypothetical protein